VTLKPGTALAISPGRDVLEARAWNGRWAAGAAAPSI